VGFDNLEFCEYTSPALSSVFQPDYQLGATAAGLLLDRINGLQDKSKRVMLETELKIRSSVLPLSSVAAPVKLPRNVGDRLRTVATKR
jgi:DNA-binding LacI/PurR family transcriptional regulator